MINDMSRKLVGTAFALALLLGTGLMYSTTALAQGPWDRDRDVRQDRDGNRGDRDDQYGRNGDYGRNGRYGGGNYRVAADRGYQDGISTGSSDASRGQSYNPQRSHYYRNATYGYNGGSRESYRQAYRDGFVRGYSDGYRRYGGNRRRGNGRWFPY